MNKKTILSLAVIVFFAGFFALFTAQANAANPFSNNKQGLLNYFNGLPGRSDLRVVSGQSMRHQDVPDLQEAQTIFNQTGQWVGLIGQEYTRGDGTINYAGANSVLTNYWNQGGLVSVHAHFKNPTTGGGAFDPNVNFTDLLTPGTPTYNTWISTLDEVAAGFKQLQDSGVVVLWRPLHEMNGCWFWWNCHDAGSFKQLWIQMFNYFTYTKGLNNLIWVYAPNSSQNGTGSDVIVYYPGDQYVDIVGLDAYTDDVSPNKIIGYDQLVQTGKPFAFTEYGPPRRYRNL